MCRHLNSFLPRAASKASDVIPINPVTKIPTKIVSVCKNL